jgi:hypothetical protein
MPSTPFLFLVVSTFLCHRNSAASVCKLLPDSLQIDSIQNNCDKAFDTAAAEAAAAAAATLRPCPLPSALLVAVQRLLRLPPPAALPAQTQAFVKAFAQARAPTLR